MKCPASASRLEDCSFLGWRVNNCGHREDVGVVCCEHRNACSREAVVRVCWNNTARAALFRGVCADGCVLNVLY